VQLIISDACRRLVEAAAEVFPKTQWQRCVVHFYRNVFSHVPNTKVADIARMLKAIHAQEDRKAAKAKAVEVVRRLKEMRLKSAADPASNASRRSFSGRTLGTDAGRGEAATHRLDQVGQAALHADGIAAQSGKAGGSSMTKNLLPGLRPVRLHRGFAVKHSNRR
jgi:Transposase, Mutator family